MELFIFVTSNHNHAGRHHHSSAGEGGAYAYPGVKCVLASKLYMAIGHNFALIQVYDVAVDF